MKYAYALAAMGAFTMLAGTQAADRAPVPTAEQQAKSARTVQEIFGPELPASRTSEQSRAVARRMLQAAADSKDDEAGRFALLVRTRTVAAEAGDVKTAIGAEDQLDAIYAMADPASDRAALLAQLATTVRPGPDASLLIDEIDLATARAIARDDYNLANRSVELAVAAAARGNDAAIARRAAARAKDVREIGIAYGQASKAIDALHKDPRDPQAALAAGRFICFMKGDWPHGLVLLRSGADVGLAALAREEIRAPADGPAQMTLADGWWDMADAQHESIARRQVREHAATWYRTALPWVGGLSKAKAQKRIEEAGAAGYAVALVWVDLLHGIDTRRDGQRGAWKVIDGKLVLMSDSFEQQRIRFPYATSGDYDLSLRFNRTRGAGAVCIYVPAGAGECLIALSGWSKQLSALFSANFTGPDGASVSNDPLTNGRTYQLDVGVRLVGKDAEITVLRDQQPYMHWRGLQSDLVVPPEWTLGHPNVFGIGGDNALDVTSARVRAVGGSTVAAVQFRAQ